MLAPKSKCGNLDLSFSSEDVLDLVQQLLTHIMCSIVRSVPHIYSAPVHFGNGLGSNLQMAGLA